MAPRDTTTDDTMAEPMPDRSRVFVLGHRGMLGHLVAAYLRQAGCEVITSDLRYAGTPREPLLQAVRDSGCAWVINALGAIPQKVEDAEVFFRANTFGRAWTMITGMFGGCADAAAIVRTGLLVPTLVIVGGVVLAHVAMRKRTLESVVESIAHAWVALVRIEHAPREPFPGRVRDVVGALRYADHEVIGDGVEEVAHRIVERALCLWCPS